MAVSLSLCLTVLCSSLMPGIRPDVGVELCAPVGDHAFPLVVSMLLLFPSLLCLRPSSIPFKFPFYLVSVLFIYYSHMYKKHICPHLFGCRRPS